jgi:hypothetical protein
MLGNDDGEVDGTSLGNNDGEVDGSVLGCILGNDD